jgi:hypothetical protein
MKIVSLVTTALRNCNCNTTKALQDGRKRTNKIFTREIFSAPQNLLKSL